MINHIIQKSEEVMGVLGHNITVSFHSDLVINGLQVQLADDLASKTFFVPVATHDQSLNDFIQAHRNDIQKAEEACKAKAIQDGKSVG